MSLAIWPVSPLPAETDRDIHWKLDESHYDSGAYQAMTTFLRPLYRYNIPFKLYTEVKRATIKDFWNQQRRQGNAPFLMMDPYDYAVNSVLAVRSGYATGSGNVFLYDTNSFFVRANTTTVASLFSSLSGYVLLGTNYTYDQDTGVLGLLVKAVNDVWSARSMTYYRKCVFDGSYHERSPLWNVFGSDLKVTEIV